MLTQTAPPPVQPGNYGLRVISPDRDPLRTMEAGFSRGDEGALEEVYNEYGSLVFTYCRRSLGADTASDVTQEVFLAAWRARDRFDPEKGSLPGWLMGITKNKIIDHLRAKGRRISTVGSTETVEVVGTSDEVSGLGDRMLIADALASLPERARLIVEMAFLEDLTHVQIAERTGVPLGTIKSDIRRGLARMKRNLEGSR